MYAQIKECGLTGSIMTLYELVEGGDLVDKQGQWPAVCIVAVTTVLLGGGGGAVAPADDGSLTARRPPRRVLSLARPNSPQGSGHSRQAGQGAGVHEHGRGGRRSQVRVTSSATGRCSQGSTQGVEIIRPEEHQEVTPTPSCYVGVVGLAARGCWHACHSLALGGCLSMSCRFGIGMTTLGP